MKIKSLIKEHTTHKRIALEIDSEVSSEVFNLAFPKEGEGALKFRQEIPGTIIFVEGVSPIVPQNLKEHIESRLTIAAQQVQQKAENAAITHQQIVDLYAKALNLPVT